MRRLFTIGLAALTLSACAQPMNFEKEGVTQQEWAKDKYECDMASRAAGNVAVSAYDYGYGLQGSAVRVPNRQVAQMCMEARGYRRIK